MQPYSLQLAGVLLSFILKMTAAFVLCLCLTRVLRSPRHRFLTWLGFLLGAGVSWTALVVDQAISVVSHATAAATLARAAARVPGEHVAVPASWSIWIARAVVVLTAAYITGATSLLAVHAFKHVRLRAWLKHGRKPSADLEQIFQGLCCDFNIHRCRVLILPRVSSPATVYWWSPRVLLPEICEELVGSPQLGNMLKHELIHTLRCDYLWATIGDLLCALLFFHPAVWQARKQLMIQRELACDLGVVETHPEERADYADSLAAFVRLVKLRQRPALGVDFAASPSFLSTRIHNILAEPARVPRWKELVGDAAFVLFILVFGAVSPALSVSLDFSSQSAAVLSPHISPRSGLLLPEAPGLHRRHNRISFESVDASVSTPTRNWVKEDGSTLRGSNEAEAPTNPLAFPTLGSVDVNGSPVPVPFGSVSLAPIHDRDPRPTNAERTSAREDK